MGQGHLPLKHTSHIQTEMLKNVQGIQQHCYNCNLNLFMCCSHVVFSVMTTLPSALFNASLEIIQIKYPQINISFQGSSYSVPTVMHKAPDCPDYTATHPQDDMFIVICKNKLICFFKPHQSHVHFLKIYKYLKKHFGT